MKSILDPSFKYVSSVATDLRKTFARARRELRREQRAPRRVDARVVSIGCATPACKT